MNRGILKLTIRKNNWARKNDRALIKYFQLRKTEPQIFKDPNGPIILIDDLQKAIGVQEVLKGKAGSDKHSDCARLGVIHDGHFFRILRDPVKFPDGSVGGYTRVLSAQGRPQGVVVLPVIGGDVVLIRQYRHAVRGWRWEAPRGFAEEGETSLETAKRELFEETGMTVNSLKQLGIIEPDTGVLAICCRVFLADIKGEHLKRLGEGDEAISEIKRFDNMALAGLIKSGKLTDGLTLSALHLKQIMHPKD